jgi:xylose isomerase
MYEILKYGGLGTGGFNFDTKLRRQSIERDDLLLVILVVWTLWLSLYLMQLN